MPNLEIDRCAVLIDTTPPVHHYGWVAHGVSTVYSLPFRSAGERERFVRLLAGHVGATVAADEVDTLAAVLCLSRDPDEAAYACAAAHLDRAFAGPLSAVPVGDLDDVVDQLLREARGEDDDAGNDQGGGHEG